MRDPARVHSIDVLESYSYALATFGEEVTTVLADLGMSVNRAIQWIEQDQPAYWQEQLRRAERDVQEARLNLERKQMFRIGDFEPACHEEKAILLATKQRHRRAQEKLAKCRYWGRKMEQEFMDYKAAVAPLAAWVAIEIPKGRAVLRRMRRALTAYVNAHPPEMQPVASAGAEAEPPSSQPPEES